MKDAIDILKQEFKWVKENKALCPHSDEYYNAYIEGIKNCIDLLKMADLEDISEVKTESVKSPKIAFCEACGTALGIGE